MGKVRVDQQQALIGADRAFEVAEGDGEFRIAEGQIEVARIGQHGAKGGIIVLARNGAGLRVGRRHKQNRHCQYDSGP